MKITTSSNNVTINGNIKSINDFQKIKNHLDEIIINHKTIIINVVNSLSITSSVIGYLNKLVLKDNIAIQMKIGDTQLLQLLDDLDLVNTLNATKA